MRVMQVAIVISDLAVRLQEFLGLGQQAQKSGAEPTRVFQGPVGGSSGGSNTQGDGAANLTASFS